MSEATESPLVPEAPPTAYIIDPSELVSPSTVYVVEHVPHPIGEDDEDAKLEEFGGDPIELSLLPLYPDHTSKHIWDKEVELNGFILFSLRLF